MNAVAASAVTAPATPSAIEAAFRHTAAALALLALDGRWLDANDATCRLLGRHGSQLIGRRLHALCELTDAVALMQHLAAVVEARASGFRMDLRVPRLDGSHTWLRMDASAIPGAEGRPTHLAVGFRDVGEDRRAREERDVFFELCPDPLAIASDDGRIVRVNRAWTAALGWTSDDMRGLPFIEFVHPDDRERTIAEAERTFAGEATPHFRNRYRAKGGGWRWLEWHSQPGDDGRVYCAARDVTEQQQALIIFEAEMQRRRQRLDEAEQRLGVHVNNTPLAVVEFDAKLRVRRWSPRAEALFGWCEEEVVGDRPDQWRFIHEDDADTVATAMLSLVTGEAPSQVIHHRNYTRDDRVVHCEWFMSAVFDDDGHLSSLLAFAQDVTARIEAEAEAAEREALFRATFEQAPVGIAHVGLDGRWLSVNQTLCDFLGYPASELLATSFQDVTHPDDLDSDLAQVRQVLDGRIDRYEMRKRYRHRDGHELWAQLTVSLRRDAQGRPLHFISVVEDIAATVEAEQAIRRARDELEQRVVERTAELESANRSLATEVDQRREAEAALRGSEARIRMILENSHDAFMACDEHGAIVEWNRSAEVVFGWRRSEAIGRPLARLVLPARRDGARDADDVDVVDLAHVLDQRRQMIARPRSGREFPVEVTVSRVDSGSRRLFAAFLHDISERVAAEQKLRESEARLRTITDNMPALIAYVDRDLRYQFNNATYADWFGVDVATLLGRPVVDVIGPAALERARPHMEAALAGEIAQFHTQVSMRDGQLRHLYAMYVPDRDANGVVRGFHVLANDVTPHVQLTRMLEARALHDELTGLPNRAAWMRALDAAARAPAGEAAVMFLDLDGFKQINDTHGHDVGDAVLREFAARLRHCVRESDVVARLAGDEFVVLLQGDDDIGPAARRVASSIAEAMQPPFEVAGLALAMSGSIGIAVQRRGAFDGAQLTRVADEAMYIAKRTQDGMPYWVVDVEPAGS